MTEQEDGRREQAREGVLKAAKLLYGNTVVDCVVLDISERGARIRTSAMMALPKEVALCFRSGAAFRAELRWARAQEAGLEFTGPAALSARKAADAAGFRQGLQASGFARVIEALGTARHFDDPGLAHVAAAAKAAVQALDETLARLARDDGWRPPDVFRD
jgi:hypothetical protein